MNAFDALKIAMCSTAAFRIPDPTLPFILETDANNVTLGCMLLHGTPEDSYAVPFFYIGRSKAVMNYSSIATTI